jgi:hypothetical protein
MTERVLLHTHTHTHKMLFEVFLDIILLCYHHGLSHFLRSTAFVFSDFQHPGNVEKTKQLLKQRNTILRTFATPY